MGISGRQRRRFTAEYRREAAHLVIDTGRPITVVAREINVSEQGLGIWVRAERERLGPGVELVLTESERVELDRLRVENAQLRMDNEFLGKASAYFASKNTLRMFGR